MPDPKPRPPKNRPLLTIAEQRPLESIFRLQNPTFNRYMAMKSSKEAQSVAILEECVDVLGKADHPLLRYAAGSAAMELALRTKKDQHGNYSAEERRELVDTCQKHCLNASEGFFAMDPKGIRRNRALSMQQMGIQALHMAAYTPLMRIVAMNITHRPLAADEIEVHRAKTRNSTARLGELVMAIDPSDPDMLAVRKGLQGELACGMVGQSDVLPKRLMLPASLRQDHHLLRYIRADFIAMETTAPFRKTLLQVKNSSKGGRSADEGCVHVDAARDLVLHPEWGVDQTLSNFSRMVEETAAPDIEHRFAVVSRVLTNRIDAFRP